MALSPGLHYPIARFDTWSADGDADDGELIARSQRGDVPAFNLLVERYQQRVYALCFRMLGDADADDAAQEAFLAAYRGIQSYKSGSFGAWLLRIASNKCLDRLRARKRQPAISLDTDGRGADDMGPLQIPDEGEGPEQRVLRAERELRLERKLQELPADQRLVIILSDVQGYSYEEIIAATGWLPGTMKSRLSRARARLRVALQGTNE